MQTGKKDSPNYQMHNSIKKKSVQKKEKVQIQSNLGKKPDPVNYTCIQRMLDGAAYGKRHMIALRIASHLRWRYPEHVVKIIMEDWRMRVSTEENKSTKRIKKRILPTRRIFIKQ